MTPTAPEGGNERLLLVSGTDPAAAAEAIREAGGRVLHRSGSALVVVADDRLPDILQQVDGHFEAVDPTAVSLRAEPAAPVADDDLMVEAFQLRQSPAFRERKRNRPDEGEEWTGPSCQE